MDQSDPPIQVVAAVVVEAGRVLVTQRRDGDSYAGRWEFPGGKVDGETPARALRREILEELGIDIRVVGEYAVVDTRGETGRAITLQFLRAVREDPEQEIQSLEVAAWCWADAENLTQLDMIPSNLGVVDQLRGELSGL